MIVDQGVIEGDPIRAVSFLPPEESWDTGYAVWSVPPDAPSQNSALVCLNCFLGEHPEAGHGMDLASQHGEAIYDRNDWMKAESR